MATGWQQQVQEPIRPEGRPPQRFPSEGSWPPGPFRSASTRTTIATITNGIAAVTALATAVVIVEVFELLDRADRFALTEAEADAWLERLASTEGVEGIAGLVAIVSLMAWLSRSVDNTPALGGGIARRGPRWAIGAWFIPVVNVVMPALIIRDLARRMSPDGRGHDAIVLVWWLLYWAPLIIGIYIAVIPSAGTDSARETYAWQLAWQIVTAAGFVATIFLVRRLQQDAEHWEARLAARGPTAVPPGGPTGWPATGR